MTLQCKNGTCAKVTSSNSQAKLSIVRKQESLLKKTFCEKVNFREKLVPFAKVTFSKTDPFRQFLFYNFGKAVFKVLM